MHETVDRNAGKRDQTDASRFWVACKTVFRLPATTKGDALFERSKWSTFCHLFSSVIYNNPLPACLYPIGNISFVLWRNPTEQEPPDECTQVARSPDYRYETMAFTLTYKVTRLAMPCKFHIIFMPGSVYPRHVRVAPFHLLGISPWNEYERSTVLDKLSAPTRSHARVTQNTNSETG